MSVLEDAYASAGAEQRVVDTENQVFNTNHAVVGYYTAKSWRLPEHLSKRHRQPSQRPGGIQR